MNIFPARQARHVFAGWLLMSVLVLAGCGHFGIGTTADVSSNETTPQDSGRDPGAEPVIPQKTYPKVELTQDLLYELLLGEIAIQRRDYKTAAETLSRAARTTKDARVAERATRAAMEAGMLDEALEAARAWVELEPDNKIAKEVTALVLVEKGDIADAEALYGEILEKDASNRGLNFRRIAEMLSRRENSAAALSLMQRLADRFSDTPEGYYALAYLADRAKQDALVISAIDKALALRPGWEEAARAKIAHLATQKNNAAVIEFADQFLAQHPNAKGLRLHYARFLVEQNENEKALDQFAAVVKQDPKNADALFAAGFLSLQLKRYDQAEKFFNDNLKLRPEHAQTRLYLGQLEAERKHYPAARRWYDTIKEDDSNHYFEARVLLASVIAKTDGTDAALAHLSKLKTHTEEQFVRVTLTKELVLRENKELPRAKTILDTAVDRYPDNGELLYARGLLAAQLQMLDVHEHDMRKLLSKDPKNAHALNALGYTLADSTNRYAEAHALIKQALSIRPNDPFILDSMGWVQYRMGNLNLAIQYLEQALSKREDAEIAAHLGEVLWATGNHARAEKIWDAALKKHPKNDVLRGTIEKLKQ